MYVDELINNTNKPVTPERLMSRERLDQIRAQLQLLVEELKDCGEVQLLRLIAS